MLTIVAVFVAKPALSRQVTLEEAVALARDYNPDLAVVAKELIVARGALVRANYISQFNPSAEGAGDYRTRWGNANSQDWRVGFAQELEIFGQRALRKKSARLGVKRTGFEIGNQIRLLSGAVKLTFFEALRARRQVQLLSELEALDRRLLDAAQARFESGEISQIEANLARVRHGQSLNALLLGRQRYQIEELSLGRLLGGAAGAEPEPVGKIKPEVELENLGKLLKVAEERRPDLKAAQTEIARLQAEQALNRRLAMPNPTFGAFGGHEVNAEHFMGASLSFPIPIFNRRQAEATILAGRSAQAKDRLLATRLNIEREVRDAYLTYETARRVLQISQSDVVQPARESFNLLEQAFRAGTMDLLTVSVAERQAFEARVAYLDAWYGLVSSKTVLDLVTGRIR